MSSIRVRQPSNDPNEWTAEWIGAGGEGLWCALQGGRIHRTFLTRLGAGWFVREKAQAVPCHRGGEMTGDRLRQLAEVSEADLIDGWFTADENVVALGGDPHAALIAALGPDAARLLADAMDWAETLRDLPADGPYAQPRISSADLAIQAHDLLTRFAALGEPR